MTVLADQAVVSGSSFLTNILIARALGITDFGAYSAIILIQLFLLTIQQAVSSGIYQVLLGRFGKPVQKYYTNGLFYLQFFFFLFLITAGIFVYLVFFMHHLQYGKIFIPALTAVVLYLVQDFLRKVLITSGKERKTLFIDITTNALQLALLLFFSFYGKLNLAGACWISGLTFIPSIIAGIKWVSPGLPRWSSMKQTIQWHRNHSGWMFLSALLQWFAGNFFVVAAGWWLGLAALGALRLGQYIFGLLNVLLQAVENYALPKGTSMLHSESSFKTFLLSILKKTFIAVLPMLLLLSIFAKQVLGFSGGAAYSDYAYVMYSLSLIYLLIVAGMPVRIALRVQLLNKHYFIGYALATLFSLVFAKWMIKNWELAGVLAGLFITQLIVISYWLFILNRKKIITWKLSTSY